MIPCGNSTAPPDTDLGAAWDVGTYEWRPAEDRLSWSPGLLRIYGLQRAPSTEEGFTRCVHPDDRVRVDSETLAYLGSDATSYSHRFRIVRPDGEVRLVLDRGAIERDATGVVRAIWGINVDLTDLAEAHRHEDVHGPDREPGLREARLDAALKAGRLGVHELDPRTDRIRWDDAVRAIWGAAEGETVTFEAFAAGIHPDDLPGVRAAVATALDPEGPGRYEAVYRVVHRQTNEVRWVHADGDVTFEGDTATRLVGTVQEVTESKVADDRLRESETRYRLLHESMRDAFVQVDLTGRIQDCNEQFCELVAYGRTELEALTYLDLTPFRWHEIEAHIVETQILTRGFSDVYEKEYRRKDGSIVPVELRTVLVRDSDGRPDSMWAIVRDITARKRSEAASAESEARLRRAAGAAVFGVHDFDPSRQEASWSPEMSRILGVPAAGPMPMADVLATVHPEDRARVRAEMAAIQRRVGSYELECRIVRPDGTTRWIMDRGEAIGPVDPGTGLVARVTGTLLDISERKQTEERLRAAHDTFRQLVDRSPFGVYAVDADFRLVQVSDGAQKVFENVRPLIGRDFAEVLRIVWPEPFATQAIALFRHTLATGEPYHAPSTIERRADVQRTEAYDWKIEQITMPDGRPGVVCHFYDLSERQRHEEQIRFLMREVTHRSQNMLALIQAMVRLTAPAGTGDFVERIGERLRSLAAAQSLLISHDWKSVPLDDLVRAQLSHFADLIGTRIAILGLPLALTPAAAQALGLALHELATNAAKHGALSADGGRVAIAWDVRTESIAEPEFTMSWVELGGPPVRTPEHRGFGSEVTTSIAKMSVGGEVTVDYAPGGLQWRLACPLANVTEERKAQAAQRAANRPN